MEVIKYIKKSLYKGFQLQISNASKEPGDNSTELTVMSITF